MLALRRSEDYCIAHLNCGVVLATKANVSMELIRSKANIANLVEPWCIFPTNLYIHSAIHMHAMQIDKKLSGEPKMIHLSCK
jgi:hypothetical protein